MAKKTEKPRDFYEEESKDVKYCPTCKRVGDHAHWCATKNRPGPGRIQHAAD